MSLGQLERISSEEVNHCTGSEYAPSYAPEYQMITFSMPPLGQIVDDLSTEEITDVEEYYSGTEGITRFNSVEDLIKDLDDD